MNKPYFDHMGRLTVDAVEIVREVGEQVRQLEHEDCTNELAELLGQPDEDPNLI